MAIGAPPPAASHDSPTAENLTDGSAARQLPGTGLESGVGLFCDIEVAVDPNLPADGPVAESAYRSGGSVVAAAGTRPAKVGVTLEIAAPLAPSAQTTLTGLAGRLPLLLGAAILVTRGGLRLEEKASPRECRFHCVDDLRRSRPR